MDHAQLIRRSLRGCSERALRATAASVLVLASYTLGAAPVNAEEPASQPSAQVAEAAAPAVDPCASAPSPASGAPASGAPASGSSESTEPSAADADRRIHCQTREHADFVQEVAGLLAVDGSSLPQLLERLRGLSQLQKELERSAQNYAAPLAGSPPSTPETLLQELTRLRSDLTHREQELARTRSRLAERELALAKAMPEIVRVLEYQRELKELRVVAVGKL